MHLPYVAGKKYAFVIPRFGDGFAGGAEALVGALAEKLSAHGARITVLATCAKDNRTWENHFPPGKTIERGVEVYRFKVNQRDLDRWVPLQIRISEGLLLDIEEELTWLSESVNSSELYKFIAENNAEFDALFFAPYLFGTTFWGSLIAPQRSILIPCLHDEPYAYFRSIQSMFRLVKGCLFNALPEGELARDICGPIKGDEVGMGFEPFSTDYIDSLSPYLSPETKYFVYVGRKETGKNVHILIDYFIEGKDSGALPQDLKLVIVGGGSFSDLNRDKALARGDVLDIEHVSECDKHRLIKNSLGLIQPSTNESFSIVIMEAWLLGVPSIVHARCPVTKHHVEESCGGLYFGDSADLGGVLTLLCEDSTLRAKMANNGACYVRNKYSWEAVIKRFSGAMEIIMSETKAITTVSSLV